MKSRAPGMTLVELMVAAVVGSFILMAVHQVLTLQERAARHRRGIITAQQSSRIALELLTAELREMSAAGGDIVEATADRIGFRSSRKLGFVCRASELDEVVDVWERGEPFADGDSLFLFLDADTAVTADDAWTVVRVESAEPASTSEDCPEWIVDDASLPTRRLELSDPELIGEVARGSPVRSYTPYTYGLHQIEDQWMLARIGPDGEAVPLVGPLAPGGLQLQYFDRHGNTFIPVSASERAAISRIRITVHALAPGAVGSGNVVNTVESQLFLRNF